MPESENALWAKTRRRPGGEPSGARAPPKGRAKRRRPADSRRTFTPRRRNCAQSKYVRIVGTKKEQQKRCPTAHIAFRAPAGAKRRAPPGAPFLKGRHKFICANDNIALRGGKSPRAAPRFARRQKPQRRAPVLRAAVRKKQARQKQRTRLHPCAAAKAPRPNSWTEASAPAANRAERERRPRKRKAKTRAFAIDKPPCNRL